MGKFIDSMMESVGNNAGAGIAGALLGPVGNQIGYGLGELTGYNKALERDQLRQQQALTNMQGEANLGLMKESYKQQKQLWDATSAEAQVSHLKNAGLNPALMYAKGGTGGSTGGGGASVGGAQASDTTSRQMASNAQSMTGLAMMKAQSEIEVNKSVAERNRAEATKAAGVDTQKGLTEIESMKLQQEYQKISNEIQSATKETVIDTMEQGLKNLTAKYDKIISETAKNEAEIQTINELRELQGKELIARAALQKSGVSVNNEHIKMMENQISEIWGKLSLHGQEIQVERDKLEIELQKLDWSKTAFSISQVQDAIKAIAQGVAAFLLFGKGTAAAGKAAADRLKGKWNEIKPGQNMAPGL